MTVSSADTSIFKLRTIKIKVMDLALYNYIDNIKIPLIRSYYILRSDNITFTNIGF